MYDFALLNRAQLVLITVSIHNYPDPTSFLSQFFARPCIPISRTLETMHIQDTESSLHQEEVPAIYLSIAFH